MSRVLTVLAVVVAALAGLGLWLFYFVGTDRPYPADSIVVLAGDLGRVPTGTQLLREGVAPVLAVSVAPGTEQKLATLCAKRRVECFHAKEYSTEGEARAFDVLARKHQWQSTVIVSSRYHLRRARMLFRRCTDVSVQVSPATTTALDYLKNIPLEFGKLAYQLTFDRGC